MSSKRKYIYLEAMRIFACFFVLFNHTGYKGFFLFSLYPSDSPQFWIYMFFSVFCTVSVPLFLTISGGLLLPKDEPLKVLWTKRIFRTGTVLVVMSFLYYMREVLLQKQEFNIKRFIIILYDKDWNFSYWYLYAFLAFLISLPFLRAMVRTLKKNDYYYMIALAVLFSAIIPIAQYLLWHGEHTMNDNLRLDWLISSIVIYPLVGHFLQNIVDIEKMKKWIPLLWLINLLCIFTTCYVTYYKILVTGECSEGASQGFHQAFALINCITLFISFKYFFTHVKLPAFAEKLIASVGQCTFGIYLFHVFVLMQSQYFTKLWDVFRVQWELNYMLAAFLYCFLAMTVCYFITLILRKIPGVNKFI